MKLFPQESSSKLGLDSIFNWLLGHVQGDASLQSASDLSSFPSLTALHRELRCVDELHQCIRFDDPIGFGEFGDVRQALVRASLQGAALDAFELREVARVVELGLLVKTYFSVRREKYPTIYAQVSPVAISANIYESIYAAVDEQGEFQDSASPDLKRIRRELVGARNRVREAAMRALAHASAQGYAAEDQPTIRGGRIVIPIRAEAKRKISGFVHDVSASGQTVYIEPESALLGNNDVRELEAEEVREILAIRTRLTDRIRNSLPEIKTAFSGLTQFDVQFAKAKLARLLGGVVPEVGDSGVIQIIDGRNPALVLHFKEQGSSRKVVPFSLGLNEDQIILIISGPNAGGKSVTMKAVGLMAVMVAHGIPIPVDEKSRFDLFDAVFVDMGDEQSISDDLSTFTSHLSNLSRILNEATSSSLALIDEAGTGTDPEAGGVLARATLEQLLENRVRTVVTTHYGPLKIFAHETEGVQNGSMTFDQVELRPTYEFVAGVPGSSYAAEIAERVGLMPTVIERAKELMGQKTSSAESLIADLMSRNATLRDKISEYDLLQAELVGDKKAIRNRLAQLQAEKEAIRAEALNKASEIVQNANRAVEKAVRDIREADASKEVVASARTEIEAEKTRLVKEISRSVRKNRSRGKESREGGIDKTPIRVGDRVKMDDAQTVGEVVGLEKKSALVAFGSVQLKVKLDRLVRVGGKLKQEVRVKQQSSESGMLSVHSVKTRLDIRGKRVDEAMSEIVPFIDRGIGSGVSRVEVLHGKGTGALRQLLHDYLASAPGISRYEEAPIMEGGAGVTHIYF